MIVNREPREDENNPARSLQRWGPCHHHHDHGAGIEGAPCSRICCIETSAAGVVELRIKFHLPRHLLEQPSSSVSGYRGGQRRNSVGQPSSPVLAVALSVHTSLHV